MKKILFAAYFVIVFLFFGFNTNITPLNKITIKDVVGNYLTIGNKTEIIIQENYFEETDLSYGGKIWKTRGKVNYNGQTNELKLYDIELNKDINDKNSKWLKITDSITLIERIPPIIIYTPVFFGNFLHLLEQPLDDAYMSICYRYNTRFTAASLPYPRKEIKKFVKIPTIPKEYHKYLIHKVIRGKIIKIINDTTVVVNVGTKNGVISQLTFFEIGSNSDAEFKVLSLEVSTTLLRLSYSSTTFIDSLDLEVKTYKPQIGRKVTTSTDN
jgi:hypothetical protein